MEEGQLADLELRHRQRARCEDRIIRCAKDTGLRNLPLKGFAQNQPWCEIVALACEPLAGTEMLALAGAARRWEPKRLRLRIFSLARSLASSGLRRRLRLAGRWPWAREVTAAAVRCRPFVRLTTGTITTTRKERTPGPVNPRPPGATAG